MNYNIKSKRNHNSKWKKFNKKPDNKYKTVITYKYRLVIYLYSKYMSGNMSYDDFVAILKANGINVVKGNWKDGKIIVEYDDLDDVPEEITLHNKKGDVPDSSSKVNKSKAKDNFDVIDSSEEVTEKVVDSGEVDTSKAVDSNVADTSNEIDSGNTNTPSSQDAGISNDGGKANNSKSKDNKGVGDSSELNNSEE